MLRGDLLRIQAPTIPFCNLICTGEGFGDGDLDRKTGHRMCQYKVAVLLCRENKLKMQKTEAQTLFSAILLCARAPEEPQVFHLQTPSRTMCRVILWARFTPPEQDVPSLAPSTAGLKQELWRPPCGAT